MNFKEFKELEELLLQCTSIDEVDKLKNHEDWEIRLEAYQALGFTEKALEDEYWYVRLLAYENLGFTEKAFDDDWWEIRLETYRKFGFTEKAFEDDLFVRKEAEIYFRIQKLKNGEQND